MANLAKIIMDAMKTGKVKPVKTSNPPNKGKGGGKKK